MPVANEYNTSTTSVWNETVVISLKTYNNSLHRHVYWIYSHADTVQGKITLYNKFLSELLREVIQTQSEKFPLRKTRKYLYGTSTDFLHKMSLFEHTQTVYLSYHDPDVIVQKGSDNSVTGDGITGGDICVWPERSDNNPESSPMGWIREKCDSTQQKSVASDLDSLKNLTDLLPIKQYYQCVVNEKLYVKMTKKMQVEYLDKYGRICTRDKQALLNSSTSFVPAYFIYNYSPLLEVDVPHSDINDAFHLHRIKGSTREQWNPSCSECDSAPQFITYTNIIKGKHIIINDRGYIFQNGTRILVNSCHLALTVNSYLNPRLIWNCNTTFHNASILVLTQNYKDNYYHTLVEMATKALFYVEFLRENPDVLIHFPLASSWSESFFHMLGIENKVIQGNVTAELVLLPMGNGCSDPPTVLLQQVNAFFFAKFQGDANLIHTNKSLTTHNDRPMVVYIHRSEDRQLYGMDKILKTIRKLLKVHRLDYNVHMFNDTNLPTFEETIRIFQNAKLIIGPHGAGFSNILFAKPGTFVVEVVCYAPYTRPCFRNMAYKLGLRYYAMLTTKSNKGRRCAKGVYANATELDKVLRYIFDHLSSYE